MKEVDESVRASKFEEGCGGVVCDELVCWIMSGVDGSTLGGGSEIASETRSIA